MNCKKCGNEIKEGNEFCTNCGYSLNRTKINRLKEYKIPIIIITVWIVIIGIIIGIKAINSKKQDNENSSSNNEVNINSNIVVENATNNDIDQENNDLIDIQNQTFNLKEDDIVNFFNADPKYNYLANGYERSIVEDGNTIIYTNKTLEGTKTVGIKISTTNSKVQTIFFNYTSNEKLTNQEISTELAIQAAKGIDLIYFKVRGKRYNDLTDYEKVYDYILKFNDLILDNTYHKNLRYTVTNDSKSVTTTYEVIGDEETTTNLLEQIELIDPNNEYPVCIGEYGDYTEYWILDSEGNKIRFSDIEGFKNAIEIYKERANNKSNENIETNNNDNNTTTETSKEKYFKGVLFSTEEEAINILKEMGLPYEIKYGEDLHYDDHTVYRNGKKDLQGNIQFSPGMWIKEGETVVIYVNKYNDRKAKFRVDVASLISIYVNKCHEDGIKADTDNFVFKIKIDNKEFYTESISSSKAKEIMKTEKEIKDIINGHDWYGNDYTELNTRTYTGYGVFNLKLTINDVLIQDIDCNIYNTNVSKNTEIDDSLLDLTNYEYDYEYTGTTGLIFYIHGSLGFEGEG